MSLKMRMIQAPGKNSWEKTISTRRLKSRVEKVAEQGRGQERLGAGPTRNVEGPFRVSAGCARPRMMHAKYMLDDATVDVMSGLHTSFGIDQETLAADGAANVGRYLRWLA
jgi:hypothetical protein